MKINQISEKYWKANSKKPKLNKPHTGHESPHPGQSRGFVGEGGVPEGADSSVAKMGIDAQKIRQKADPKTCKICWGERGHELNGEWQDCEACGGTGVIEGKNPVAKNMNKFNKPATHKDKKKAMKKGEVKHKSNPKELDEKDIMETGAVLSSDTKKKFRQIFNPNKEAFGILDFLYWAEKNYPKKTLDWFDDNNYRLQGEYMRGRGAPQQPDLYSDDHAGDVNNLNPDAEPDAPKVKSPDNESLYNKLIKVEAKAKKTRLDPKCWDGYKKQGTKVKGGVRVNNCVPK